MDKPDKDAIKTDDAALLMAVAHATQLLSPDVKAILTAREQEASAKQAARDERAERSHR